MWTKENIVKLDGKLFIVTGANAGIGYEMASALYQKGAKVVLASRDEAKMKLAASRISTMPGSGVIFTEFLDLSDFQSIQHFSHRIGDRGVAVDALINNAGIMMPPASLTNQGHESQFGINFLGHFALTLQILPFMSSLGGRVVTVGSGAHMLSNGIDYDNLRLEKDYNANSAYNDSKLANMIFIYELQRRLTSSLSNVISVGAHPGVVRTTLQRHIETDFLEKELSKFKVVMEPWQGALTSLYAATDPNVTAGDFFGPDGEKELDGYPKKSTRISQIATNVSEGEKLWLYAQQVTGLKFP